MGLTLIHDATVVNEGVLKEASVIIEADTIQGIYPSEGGLPSSLSFSKVIEARGKYLFPGVIDDHVHFREPGLTHKATIGSESRAAVAGGVTSFFDMPNCKPQTTTMKTLEEKQKRAAETSLANYSFYLGATKDNLEEIERVNPRTTCGVKLFMGSSTGNMLVDDTDSIRALFRSSPLIVAAHCEDTAIIEQNMRYYTELTGGEPPVKYHPLIRSAEACYAQTSRALDIAAGTDVRLHILHISTARELELFSKEAVTEKQFTAEACPAHLMFSSQDYELSGTRIKCNPAIKTESDREALQNALTSGLVDVIGTDHAPHLLSEKAGGCKSAASGMPSLPYSLPVMLELHSSSILDLTDISRLMCHNPALLFGVRKRGFIREGYKADLTLVSRSDYEATVPSCSLCGWNPFEGRRLHWKVESTWVNGNLVYDNGAFAENIFGELIEFDR